MDYVNCKNFPLTSCELTRVRRIVDKMVRLRVEGAALLDKAVCELEKITEAGVSNAECATGLVTKLAELKIANRDLADHLRDLEYQLEQQKGDPRG